MWKKFLIIILLFYLFALLQNSFFTHFNPLGAVPNLVFILFFLLIFFERPKGYPGWEVIFYSVAAGFFLDIFSYTYIGPSIVLLIIIGFTTKSLQTLLKNQKDSYPFIYFLPLFIIFLSAYSFLLGGTIFSAIYSIVIASILFYLYKKFLNGIINDRQLSLFNR